MKALAKERLEARKRKLQQKKEKVSEEVRLRSEDDLEQLEDMAQTQGGWLDLYNQTVYCGSSVSVGFNFNGLFDLDGMCTLFCRFVLSSNSHFGST